MSIDADLDPDIFATMVASVGVGVGIYTIDGEYVYVNDAYAELFNASPQELVGTCIWEVAPAVEPDRFIEYISSLEDGETRESETVHRYNDVEVPVETVTTKWEIDGTPYFFGTIKDISQRNAREEKILRQNERLENFASVVSHDLRNPLNVAQGYVEILQDDGVSRDELQLVHNALERMETLISELLSLARADEDVSDMRPVSVVAVAQRAWDAVLTDGATLLTPGHERTVLASDTRLQQLFENLFRNAVEHGGTDVTITVGYMDNGFYVSDDGDGLSSANHSRVFETGYTTTQEGTGFGLSIVQQIAAAHGWEVTATDSASGGARFEVTGVELTSS